MILGILLYFLRFSKEFSIVVTEAKNHDISEPEILWEDNRNIQNVSICWQKQYKCQTELPRDLSPLWGREGKEKWSHIKDKELVFGKTSTVSEPTPQKIKMSNTKPIICKTH